MVDVCGLLSSRYPLTLCGIQHSVSRVSSWLMLVLVSTLLSRASHSLVALSSDLRVMSFGPSSV